MKMNDKFENFWVTGLKFDLYDLNLGNTENGIRIKEFCQKAYEQGQEEGQEDGK